METKALGVLFVVCVFALASFASFAESLEGLAEKTISVKKQTQRMLDSWAEEKKEIQARIKVLSEERKVLLDEVDGLKKDIEEEKERIKDLEASISKVKAVRNELSFHLLMAVSGMENEMKRGIPFYLDDRLGDLERLKKTIRDPSVSLPVKYKRFLEFFQRELGYGYTVEPYYGTLRLGDSNYYGEFLRVGRIALYFRTTSGDVAAWYDPSSRSWRRIKSSTFERYLSLAFDIARRRRAAELVRLPVGRVGGLK